MTSRERLLGVLRNQPVDRVPIAPFIQQEFMTHYLHKSNTNRVTDALVCAKELGFDLITKEFNSKPFFLKKSFPNWEVREESKVDGGNYYRITTIQTPKKLFRQVEGAPYKKDILSGIHFVTTEFMINSKEDFEIFREYMPVLPKEHFQEIHAAGTFVRNHVGEYGIHAPWCMGGVFNLVCTFINIQNMLMDALINQDYYHEYMSFFTDLLCADMACYAESDYDVVGMQGNMTNGSVMGADHFRNFVLPYEKRAIDSLQGAKPVLYHNCGVAKALLPVYKELGIKIYETLSPEPMGDTVLQEAKQLFADTDMVLCGTFDQVNFLKTATEEEVYAKAQKIMNVGKVGGNYIFAASDYLEMGTPINNVKAMIAGALSAAAYGEV